MSVEDKLDELKANRKEALQALQEAQTRVQELTALVQRQSGAITALEELIELSDANDAKE
jgi:orotate phosphoribosyltransferase